MARPYRDEAILRIRRRPCSSVSPDECCSCLCYYTSEMACPYFRPTEPSRHDLAPQHAMLPLGGLWAGMCHASPDSPCEPDAAALLPLCNLGYARGACSAFPREPTGRTPSASRSRRSPEASSDSTTCWNATTTRFHTGRWSSTRRAKRSPTLPPMKACGRQARAYLASYLRRKAEAFVR